MKFFLMSDEDFKSLQAMVQTNDKALHQLETSLHTTDAIPSDYGDSINILDAVIASFENRPNTDMYTPSLVVKNIRAVIDAVTDED